jgi:hypothetical protein
MYLRIAAIILVVYLFISFKYCPFFYLPFFRNPHTIGRKPMQSKGNIIEFYTKKLEGIFKRAKIIEFSTTNNFNIVRTIQISNVYQRVNLS